MLPGARRCGMWDLGWVEAGSPWVRSHAPLPLRLPLVRVGEGRKQDLRQVQHDLRESWRHTCFGRFRAQDRVEASKCRTGLYDAARLKKIQGMDLSSHEFAGLTGGFVSPARFKIMSPDSMGCPWCSCDPGEASLWHCVWMRVGLFPGAGASWPCCKSWL